MQRGLSNVWGLRLLYQRRVQLVALAVVLALQLVVRLLLVLASANDPMWGYDFSSYWTAGRNVLDGRPLYVDFQLTGQYPTQGIQFEYLYPPFFAVVVAPFAALFDNYRTGNWFWGAMWASISLIAVVRLGDREGLTHAWRGRVLLAVAVLGFAPVIGELIIGGVQLPILVLLIGAWLALRDESPRGDIWAGALVGAAALIKVFPGVLILWFLLTGRFRAAVAAVIAMAVLAAVTVPVVGLQPWLDYPTVLLNQGPPVDPRDLLAPSVWLSNLVSPTVARVIVTLVGVGLVMWAARARRVPIGFAIAVVVSILISPALYQHYLSILVLPLVLALRWAPPPLWVAVAYLLMSGGEQDALGDLVWIVNRALPTLGALLCLVGLAWFGRRAPADRPTTDGPTTDGPTADRPTSSP